MLGDVGGGAFPFAAAHAGHWSQGGGVRSRSAFASAAVAASGSLQHRALAVQGAASSGDVTASTAVRASAIAWQQQLSGIQIARIAASRRWAAVTRTT